jgi:hypothetical protein
MEFEIRVYDAQGKFVRKIGRQGKGPGEFNYAPIFWFAGDTVVAVDRNLMRGFALSPAGKVLGTWSEYGQKGLTIRPVGRSGPGWLVSVEKQGQNDDYEEAMRRQVAGIRLKPGEIGEMPATELRRYYPGKDSLGPTVFRIREMKLVGVETTKERPLGFTARSFDDESAFAVDGRGFVFAKVPTEYRVEVYDPSGRQVGSLRRDYTPVPITLSDFDGLPQLMVENMSRSMTVMSGTVEAAQARMLTSFERQVGEMKKGPLPPARYPLGRVLVSPGGTVWVERADYMKPGVRQAMKSGPSRVGTRWDIMDVSGRYVGTTDLPVGYRLQSVTDDGRAIGVYKDEDGVEYVIAYRVVPTRR